MINVLKDNLIFEKDEVLKDNEAIKNNKLTKIYLSSYYSKLEGN